MIRISDITLPESAVWANEISNSTQKTERETCPDGVEVIFADIQDAEIDIYIPKISGELPRRDVLRLKALAEGTNGISININGTDKKCVFRHSDKAIDLHPISPRQTHTDNDSYYGYIRLLEV
jgi:hypothetical protein